MLTHESKKPEAEAEPKSDEITMLIKKVSMHQSNGQIDEPSEVKETPNEDTTTIEEETLLVDEGTKEEIHVRESFSSTSITPKESSCSSSIEETSKKSRIDSRRGKPSATIYFGVYTVKLTKTERLCLKTEQKFNHQIVPVVSSKVSVDELAKPSEKSNLKKKLH